MIFGRWGKCSLTRFIGDCSPDFLRSSPAGCPLWWCWWWWWWSSWWILLARVLMLGFMSTVSLFLSQLFHLWSTIGLPFYHFPLYFSTIFHRSQAITFPFFAPFPSFITWLLFAIKWVSQMWTTNISQLFPKCGKQIFLISVKQTFQFLISTNKFASKVFLFSGCVWFALWRPRLWTRVIFCNIFATIFVLYLFCICIRSPLTG